jgi:mxaC protein
MSFDQAAWLWLLPLALLPLLAPAGAVVANAWVATLPRDRASEALGWALRGAALLAIGALVIALAGPYRPEDTVERVGRGAEIVLVLDRSRSMDERFAGGRPAANAPKGTGPEALDYYMRLRDSGTRDSKGKVARQLLAEFAARRTEDRFGMIVFSTLPMRVLDFTQKNEAVQAAIAAGDIGRGLADTDIGAALLAALGFFEDRAYTGSRIILLVSDGGDHLDVDTRERIAHLARKQRVSLYWIYIRANTSPGLMAGADEPPANADTVPEYFLHRYFQTLGTPYRAYEAENPEALQKAIAEVDRLENLPITYLDTVPRRDLSPWCFGAALAGVLLLLGASFWEIRTWS